MKKFLLSLVAVFAALSMSAQQVDYSSMTSADAPNTVTFGGGWSWVGNTGFKGEAEYFDASAYDYLILECESASCEFSFLIQHDPTGEEGQWGPIYYESNATVAKSSKPFAFGLELNKDHKDKVGQIAMQNHNDAGNCVIKAMYFGTKAELDAAVEKYTIKYDEGKAVTMDGGNIIDTEFDGYSMDAKVEFVYTVDGDASKYQNWGAGSVSSLDSSTKLFDCPVQGLGENKVTVFLSEMIDALSVPADWTDVNAYGLYWNMWGFEGCTCTIKSVTIYEQVGSTSEKYVAKGLVSKKADPLYVIGNVNGGDWTPNQACAELAYADGVYSGTIVVNDNWEGDGWFAIGATLSETAEDWSTFNADRYSVVADWGTIGEAGTLVKGADASFKLAAGTYTVTVDLAAMTVTITEGGSSISALQTSAAKTGKFMENGKVVIYKNGQKFNVAGQLVK